MSWPVIILSSSAQVCVNVPKYSIYDLNPPRKWLLKMITHDRSLTKMFSLAIHIFACVWNDYTSPLFGTGSYFLQRHRAIQLAVKIPLYFERIQILLC